VYSTLAWLVAVRPALDRYLDQHADLLPAGLTADEWLVLERLVSALGPVDAAVRQLSDSAASLSDVLPVITALTVTLQRHRLHSNDTDAQVAMRHSLPGLVLIRHFQSINLQVAAQVMIHEIA